MSLKFGRILWSSPSPNRVVNGVLSSQLCSSTGSPQGCLLSPLLFILYMCQSKYENKTIIKYADDSVIVSLLQKNLTSHGPIIEDFVKWCEESHLQLNISQTKYMIIDFRKHASPADVTTIKTQPVQYVDLYKYLGTIIDFKLNFEENCIAVCKKGHQRLHSLRKLFFFHVDKTIMTLFYHAFIKLYPFLWFHGLEVFLSRTGTHSIRW